MSKYFVITAILFALSCDNNDNPTEDYRCTNLITVSANTQILSNSEIDSIQILFARNNLNGINLQYYRFTRNDNGNKFVHAFQFVNDLRVFTDDLFFDFDAQDSLVYIGGEQINNIDLSNTQRLSKARVREIFIEEFKKDDLYLTIFKNRDTIENNCIDVEFGYYDLNSGTSFQPKKYTKAWYVRPHNIILPYAYIDDTKGSLIYYTNGIIINKK